MNVASSARADGARMRAIAAAARTEKTVANTVAQIATLRPFEAAMWICRDWMGSKSASYHWSERPGGRELQRLRCRERRYQDDDNGPDQDRHAQQRDAADDDVVADVRCRPAAGHHAASREIQRPIAAIRKTPPSTETSSMIDATAANGQL
jgi:hypothetical protein